MMQFVNIKIYMFGITAITGYIVEFSSSFRVLLFFELFIATMGTVATGTWIGIGVLIQKFYMKQEAISDCNTNIKMRSYKWKIMIIHLKTVFILVL